jgi:hypothetical protein
MFPFSVRTGKIDEPGALDMIVWRLLDTPVHDRQVALMAALQAGEVRLSQTSEVLLTVERIESLSLPIRPVELRRLEYISPEEPYWRHEGRRFIFADAA